MISIIIPCGKFDSSDLENDRLIKFSKQLESFKYVKFNENDEIIFVESSPNGPKLQNFIRRNYRGSAVLKYNFIEPRKEDEGFFNQSLIKNVGILIAKNDFILYINSDIILQNNALQTLKQSFEENPNRFIICARHDIFLNNNEVNENFYKSINQIENYQQKEITLEDAGWYYCLDKDYRTEKIKNDIKLFTFQEYNNKLNYDFMSGYIVFGDFIAVKKEFILQNPFDENCLALTDAFIRDILFSRLDNLEFYPIHHLTSCFHLSGSDYQGQVTEDNPKRLRLHHDQEYLMKKYPELNFWSIFGFHKEFIDFINTTFTKEEIKNFVDKYFTAVLRTYYTNKVEFEQEYGIKL